MDNIRDYMAHKEVHSLGLYRLGRREIECTLDCCGC
jgi:hypothetical protein